MQKQENLGKELSYLTVLPDGYVQDRPYPLVMMLHGFGSNMYDLADLAPALNPKEYVYVCPNGPLEMQPGFSFAWSRMRNMASPADVQQDLHRSEQMLGAFFDEVCEKYHVPLGRAVLLGFSQGGGMSVRTGISRPQTFGGLVSLCGVIPEEPELRPKLPAGRSQRLFIAYGEQDQALFQERAHSARKVLESAGYQVFFKGYPMGHQITAEVVSDLGTWLPSVLAPKSTASA